MSLAPGSRLGVYEVIAAIGEGGMGQVYRATDTTLGRDVAIKILPDGFASDPDRLARFEREAKTLASLNHPHIAAIYGFEKSASLHALVMELVEGEDLSRKIEGLRAKGQGLPLDEALPIARQIAEALEAAHEQGIVHRDLKPANIKVRSDGTVKVLDFGLAKAAEPGGRADGGSMSPTITTPAMTQAGMILGTAAYMSPEQARGKVVDKRADIWAFGAVLFEMLTGQRAFPGEDVTDTIVSIVSKEPDWSALPASAPVGVRRLLARCLNKDAKARLRDIGDARYEIGDLQSGGPEATVSASGALASPAGTATRRRILVGGSVALLVGSAVLATWTLTRPAPRTSPLMRLTIVPPAAKPLVIGGNNRRVVFSADGTHLVYVSPDGQLMIRAMDQLDAVALGSITDARNPFFSPDGRWIGFFTGGVVGNSGELKRVSIGGGPALVVCRYQGAPRGATWGPDDTILFATNDPNNGLFRVSAAGGEPTVLTTPDAANGEAGHWFPSFLPGGRAALFTIRAPGGQESAQVAVVDLSTGQRTTLLRGGSQAEYIDGGFLVYALDGALRAVRFDLRTRAVDSDPVTVVEPIQALPSGAAEFSVSRQGALVYVPGGTAAAAPRSLVWVTRNGRESAIAAPPRFYATPRISPDGLRVALDIRNEGQGIWIWDLGRQTITRLTDSVAFNSSPVWTPDGQRVIFASSPAGSANLFWRAADGTGIVERLTTSPNDQGPMSMTPDGKRLVVREIVSGTGSDLRLVQVEGVTGTASPATPRQSETLLNTTFNELRADLSPDGRWIAYESDESGRYEISVRPFPNVDGGRWTISTGGGTNPVWARNGKELFFLDAGNALMAVSVRAAPTFTAGSATKLFDARTFSTDVRERSYDVSPDGQRFLMIKENGAASSVPANVVIVLNWVEELKAKVASSIGHP